jgi:pSer/pThr/pTyr-binding forkhead associated (FHA) protein
MHDDETRILRPDQVPDRIRAPKGTLVIAHSNDPKQVGRRFSIEAEDVSIGREQSNTIVVPSDSASRRHARIFASGGSHVLVDLESTNGTLLNGKAIQEQTLRDGDVIRVGSTVLKYTIARG